MLLLPLTRALSQLDDPVFLGVVLRSLGWAVLVFVVLAELLSGGAHEAVLDWGPDPAAPHWIDPFWVAWLGYAAGPVGAALLALVLFLPVACVIATLYIDRVAEAVERRWYPAVPPAAPAPLGQQVWDGLALGLKVLALQLLALLLSLLLPGVGLLLGWLIAAWAIGRGLFVAVAMRRMGRREARLLCRDRLGAVVAQGGWMAALAVVPLLNLLAPVLGTAALVHVLHAPGRRPAGTFFPTI
jgi:uncharacterized protein involved in cysteine biosynthesis